MIKFYSDDNYTLEDNKSIENASANELVMLGMVKDFSRNYIELLNKKENSYDKIYFEIEDKLKFFEIICFILSEKEAKFLEENLDKAFYKSKIINLIKYAKIVEYGLRFL